MSKKKLTIIISILVGVILSVTVLVSVSAYTDDDPLITLSYLEQVILPQIQGGTLETSQASNTYTLLELEQGQIVTANSICEFIVRPGSKVSAVSPFPAQGIADITNGIEVLADELISINAYCLIPRGDDGRGIMVLSEKAYVMIRGDYTIG